MWVVKLGGSLQQHPAHLEAWLEVLQAQGSGTAVVVPGGGMFAEQVREAQHRYGFNDKVAHNMALLAMEQYGYMLTGLAPALKPCTTMNQICSAISANRLPLWLPSHMIVENSALPASWAVTSDSLALWLAGELGAQGIFLVKSAPLPAGATSADLATAGLVDEYLPEIHRTNNIPLYWLCSDEASLMRAILRREIPPKRPVVP